MMTATRTRRLMIISIWIILIHIIDLSSSDDGCYETKCRANVAQKWDNACWTNDIADAKNCADGYEARPIIIDKDESCVMDSAEKCLIYFTCCPSDYEGIVEQQRQCDSTSCSSGSDGNRHNGECLVLTGEEEENLNAFEDEEGKIQFNNACNDDYYKYPNLVISEATHIIYNCCSSNDGSLEKYYKTIDNSMDITGRCDASACSDLEENNNCILSTGYGAFPEPFTCSHDRFKYPNLVNRGGDRWDWYGGWTMYNCCEIDDGSLSSTPLLSDAGFYRNSSFYYTIIPQMVISSIAATLLAVLIISILFLPETRSESYNLYIMFLALPDLIQNIFVIVTYSMILMDVNPYEKIVGGDYFVVSYLIYIACFVANIWINTIVAYEMKVLVLRSNRRMRSNPPSRKRVLLQCCGIYFFTIIIDFLIYISIIDLKNSTESFAVLGLIFIFCILLPCGYLIDSGCRIWKTGLLSLTGRTRSLTIYFGHIILLFFAFMIPYFGIIITARLLSGMGINLVWANGVGLYSLSLQGAMSAAFSMSKQDILKSTSRLGGFGRRSLFFKGDLLKSMKISVNRSSNAFNVIGPTGSMSLIGSNKRPSIGLSIIDDIVDDTNKQSSIDLNMDDSDSDSDSKSYSLENSREFNGGYKVSFKEDEEVLQQPSPLRENATSII